MIIKPGESRDNIIDRLDDELYVLRYRLKELTNQLEITNRRLDSIINIVVGGTD